MPRHESIKINAYWDALRTCQSTDSNLTFILYTVDVTEILLSNEVNLIINARILANPTFKTRLDDLSDELDSHPALAPLAGISQCFRCSLRADFRNYAVEVVITLRNTDETSNLGNTIAAAFDDHDS